jgi:uncharacterized protein with LGFP repeats
MGNSVAFHGEVASTDASGAGVAFTLYPEGSTTALTLDALDRVVVEHAAIARAVAGSFGIFVITDAAGKRVVKTPSEAALSFEGRLDPPFRCPQGVTPVLIAAAGKISAAIQGHVIGG